MLLGESFVVCFLFGRPFPGSCSDGSVSHVVNDLSYRFYKPFAKDVAFDWSA